MSDDPTLPKDHEPDKADVEVWVPMIRQYGIVHAGGAQTIYQSVSHPSGGASIHVHPDHLARVLRAIEGSKLLNLLERAPEAAIVRDADRLQSLEASAEVPISVVPLESTVRKKPAAKKRAGAKK